LKNSKRNYYIQIKDCCSFKNKLVEMFKNFYGLGSMRILTDMPGMKNEYKNLKKEKKKKNNNVTCPEN